MTQRESSLLFDSIDPHNIRLQQTPMLRGSYYATILVV
jgi:hypothetical protein